MQYIIYITGHLPSHTPRTLQQCMHTLHIPKIVLKTSPGSEPVPSAFHLRNSISNGVFSTIWEVETPRLRKLSQRSSCAPIIYCSRNCLEKKEIQEAIASYQKAQSIQQTIRSKSIYIFNYRRFR